MTDWSVIYKHVEGLMQEVLLQFQDAPGTTENGK
jgi:hypothetical protein